MKKIDAAMIAEYFVFLEGVILLLAALETSNPPQALTFLIGGVMLLIISLGTNRILKRLIGKDRPIGHAGLIRSYQAFPSGHATGLGAMTVLIFERSLLLGSLSLLLTFFILRARYALKMHDGSDIVAGLLLGAMLAYIFMPQVMLFVQEEFLPALVSVVNFSHNL